MHRFSFKIKLFCFFLAISLIFTKVFLLPTPPKPPAVLSVQEVINSAYVGIKESQPSFFRYSLFGYTSAYAAVKLEAIGLSQEVKADKTGYFEFNDFLANSDSKEFCLLTIDTENLIAPPLCIPVPKSEPNQRYGPYLLPPTLQLSKGDLETEENGQIMGKTIPHTQVTLNLFAKNNLQSKGLIKSAYAKDQEVEKINLQTANDGSFISTLSSKTAGKKRVFAQALFSYNSGIKMRTPKSLTLTVNIFSSWLAIVITIWNWLRSLLTLNNFLILQLLLLAYLLYKKLYAKKWMNVFAHKQRAIVLYQEHSLIKAEKGFCSLYTHQV